MRIVGQQGAPGGRSFGGDGEGIGRARQTTARNGPQKRVIFGVGLGELGLRQRREKITRQNNLALAGNVGMQVAKTLLRQDQRGAGAQHFFTGLSGQLQRHQLDDRDAVGGLPRGDLRFEQEKLGRATSARLAVYDLDPGIHAGGISLQHRQRFVVLRRDRPYGGTV